MVLPGACWGARVGRSSPLGFAGALEISRSSPLGFSSALVIGRSLRCAARMGRSNPPPHWGARIVARARSPPLGRSKWPLEPMVIEIAARTRASPLRWGIRIGRSKPLGLPGALFWTEPGENDAIRTRTIAHTRSHSAGQGHGCLLHSPQSRPTCACAQVCISTVIMFSGAPSRLDMYWTDCHRNGRSGTAW